MNRTFLRYLMMSVAAFAPPGDPPNGGANQGDDQGGDDLDLGVDDLDTDQGGDDQGGDDQDDNQGGGDDDDDDDQEGDDDDQEGDDPPAGQQSRGQRDYGTLRRTARETARQNAELTRQLAELRGEVTAMRTQPAQQVETAQQRADRLALLSPEERMQEMLNTTLAQHERNNQVLAANMFDQSDKLAYESRANSNPILRKIAPEVERVVQEQRSKGLGYDRATIAAFLIGQKVLAKNNQQNPGRQQRRNQQRANPVNAGRNNVDGQQRQRRGGAPVTADDYEAQFGDVSI